MSSQSSSDGFIQSLKSAQKNLYRFIGPIIICIGTASGILSLIVFTQKSLRKNPCSIYFIAYNIASLLFIYTSFLPLTLEIGFDKTATTYNLLLCRCRLYTTFLFKCLCPFYLLLASVDRIVVTSRNARTRQRSSHRLAYKSILIGTLCWIFGLSHVLIFSKILQLLPDYFVCYLQLGWYSMAVGYGSIIKEILIPLLMAIFGLWSIKNIRMVRRITVTSVSVTRTGNHTGHVLNSIRSKDRQLILMLLIDITIYIFFSFTMAISLMHEQITLNRLKSEKEKETEIFVKSVAMFAAHIPFCINSYANLLVSKTFRKEVKHLILWKRVIYFCRRHERLN